MSVMQKAADPEGKVTSNLSASYNSVRLTRNFGTELCIYYPSTTISKPKPNTLSMANWYFDTGLAQAIQSQESQAWCHAWNHKV